MPDLFERVKSSPNICGVELSFTGDLIPSVLEGWQPFYNSLGVDCDFIKTYIGLGSVAFDEESAETNSGTQYKQKLAIRFPSTDPYRSERIELFKKAKYVKINLTDGRDFVFGRNDFNQNAKPKFALKSNTKISQIEFESVSIFPTGFAFNAENDVLPILLL